MATWQERKKRYDQANAAPAVRQQYQPQQTQYPTQGYQGLAGVSENTARQAGSAQAGYQQGQAVQQAQNQMQQLQAQKPQSYNSKYSAQLDEMMARIKNPEQFKYEFNGDNLFKAYADLYTQKGKQASLDAQGQAAALTGGYGNSYGQMLGQQQYDQYLLSLYDKGIDLYDRAYQANRDKQNDLYNAYGLMQDAENTAYNRYRDEVGDWQNERAYYTDRYDTEAAREYDRYAADRDYWTGLAKIENADYRNEQDRQEAIRQYEQNFAEQAYRADQDEAYRQAQMLENMYQADQDEAYRQQQFAENVRQYDQDYAENVRRYDQDFAEQAYRADQDEAYRQAQLQENIRQFNESLDWDKMSSDQKYAYQYAMAILENGQMPTAELLAAAGLSPEDAAKLMAIIAPAGGGPQKTQEPKGAPFGKTNTSKVKDDQNRQSVIDKTSPKGNNLIYRILSAK